MYSKHTTTAIIAIFVGAGLLFGVQNQATIRASSAVKLVCFPGKSGDMGLGKRIAQRYQALGLATPAVRNLGSTQIPTLGKRGLQGVRGSCIAIYPEGTFVIPSTQEVKKLRSPNFSVFSSAAHGGKMFVPNPNVPQTRAALMDSQQVEFHISDNAINAMKAMRMLPATIDNEPQPYSGVPVRFNQ